MENINKEKIIKDYYKCIGAFKNCYTIYNALNVLKTVDNVDKDILEGRREDLLSNLGKVGEKAFKYLYGLEIIKIYPNIDEDNFESHFCKNGPLKEFIKKHGIDLEDEKLNEIFAYVDINNQKSHNYDYWYKVLHMTMPDLIRKYEKLTVYNKQSEILCDFCEKNRRELGYDNLIPYYVDATFPEMFEVRANSKLFLKKEQVKNMLEAQQIAIAQSGDIFTRLRYASNNPDKKEFNLDEIFSLISNLIMFIEMIHENNDDLNIDLDFYYGKTKALEYKANLGMTEEEINEFFSLGLSSNILAIFFFEKVSLKYIKSLLEVGVKKEDLLRVYLRNLNSRSIDFFHQLGITDYNEMQKKLEKFIKDGKPISR